MCLDGRRRALEADAFDHVRIERSLDQIFDTLELLRLDFEIFDEEASDVFPLALRIGHIFQSREKLRRAIQDPEIQMQVRGESLLHLVAFTGPQHSIVDEDAGQLVADGPMGRRCRDGRIHPSAQGAKPALLPDLLATLLDRGFDIPLHGPRRLAAADLTDEISNQLCAVRGVRDFAMDLEAVYALLAVAP